MDIWLVVSKGRRQHCREKLTQHCEKDSSTTYQHVSSTVASSSLEATHLQKQLRQIRRKRPGSFLPFLLPLRPLPLPPPAFQRIVACTAVVTARIVVMGGRKRSVNGPNLHLVPPLLLETARGLMPHLVTACATTTASVITATAVYLAAHCSTLMHSHRPLGMLSELSECMPCCWRWVWCE